MITLFFSAFLMGAVGSLHCIGMCGPLALTITFGDKSVFNRFLSTLLYNAGRVITYSILGLFAGLIGSSVSFFGFGQLLSVLLGIIMILFVLIPNHKTARKNIVQSTLSYTNRWLSNLLRDKKYSSSFYVGLLNGLLPCGLIYMALAGAVATASVVSSSLFMAAFGLGTLPLMWVVTFWGANIKMNVRSGIKRAYPYLILIMAIFLIIRGLGLGIPYLSPMMVNDSHSTTGSMVECHD